MIQIEDGEPTNDLNFEPPKPRMKKKTACRRSAQTYHIASTGNMTRQILIHRKIFLRFAVATTHTASEVCKNVPDPVGRQTAVYVNVYRRWGPLLMVREKLSDIGFSRDLQYFFLRPWSKGPQFDREAVADWFWVEQTSSSPLYEHPYHGHLGLLEITARTSKQTTRDVDRLHTLDSTAVLASILRVIYRYICQDRPRIRTLLRW
ncbi:hypothetical protein EV360DRAFT_70043 [Lentinula raphanica]|nr:hypothetical protein EV360DRAFT_70043 [Lentinula raphanica]